MSTEQDLRELTSEILKLCEDVTNVKAKEHLMVLGMKSMQLALEAMQLESQEVAEESTTTLKKIRERLQLWSSEASVTQGRKSGMTREVDQLHSELDQIIKRIQEIVIKNSSSEIKSSENEGLPTVPANEDTGPVTYPMSEGEIPVSPTPTQDDHKASLIASYTLASILSTSEKRKALQDLEGESAQSIINFLYTLLSEPPSPSMPWFHNQTLLALRKLCGSSMLYPSWYMLKDITDYKPRHGDIASGKQGSLELCLKVVRLNRDEMERTLKLCAKEAIVWGQLRHPNILRFYGIFYLDEGKKKICLVSPWMENGNVNAYLKKNPDAARKPLVRDVALGLEYLHNENIIHGGLKGTNILVDQFGRACIADFGSFTIRVDRIVATSSYTDRWVSPELLQEDALPSRPEDVWSFGCVCYEIVSRRLPYHSIRSRHRISMALLKGIRPAIRDKEPVGDPRDRIDDETWELMNWCWSHEPEKRPTCEEILKELERQGVDQRDSKVQDTMVPETITAASTAKVNLNKVQGILNEIDAVKSAFGHDSGVTEMAEIVVMGKLTYTLENPKLRTALCDLKDDKAQCVLNYLQSILLQLAPEEAQLRNSCLIALYELSKTSSLYPRCYELSDIVFESYQGGSGLSDIHKVSFGKQHLCLKVVRLYKSSDMEVMVKHYTKEAIRWAHINHPNIAPFYGVYYRDKMHQQICLVSPWMSNGNIVDYLGKNPLTPRIPFICDITSGLEYLHEQGLVHGNLKGMNVLLNGSREACLTDLGLLSVCTDPTLAGTVAVSNAQEISCRWFAPELLDDGAFATVASDIWALGCVFYEILTGMLPFNGLSDIQALLELIDGHIPAQRKQGLNQNNTTVIIWTLIYKCWTIEPGMRPACQDILHRLESSGLKKVHKGKSQNHVARGRWSFWNAIIKNQNQEFLDDLMKAEEVFDQLVE